MAVDAYDLEIAEDRRGRLPIAEGDPAAGELSYVAGVIELEHHRVALAAVDTLLSKEWEVRLFGHEHMFSPAPDGKNRSSG